MHLLFDTGFFAQSAVTRVAGRHADHSRSCTNSRKRQQKSPLQAGFLIGSTICQAMFTAMNASKNIINAPTTGNTTGMSGIIASTASLGWCSLSS